MNLLRRECDGEIRCRETNRKNKGWGAVEVHEFVAMVRRECDGDIRYGLGGVALGFRLVIIYIFFFIVSYVIKLVRFIPVQSVLGI